MVRQIKYVALLLSAGFLVYLFGLASREIEGEIGNFPFVELMRGKGGIDLLKPAGISFLLFLAVLVTILVLTGTTTLTPSWVGWAYASLLPVGLFLYLRDQIGTIYGGLLFAAIMWHLGAVKKEIHLRIRFNPSLLGRGRSMVALVLLLVLLVPCYKGTGQLVETRGRVIQGVAEEKLTGWIDQQLPRLVVEIFRSEQLASLREKLPAGVSLEDLQRELLSHLPKGNLVVAKTKEEIPKIISLSRHQVGLILKSGPQGLFLLVMLASVILWPVSILMILANVLSAMAGLLTKIVLSLLIHTGVITETAETVELKRLTF